MKSIKRYISAIIIAITAVFMCNAANASCTPGFIKITDVYHFPTSGYAYIYGVLEHQYGVVDTVYYFYTYDTAAISNAVSLHNSFQSVKITGDQSSCPGSGYVYGGQITTMDSF
jgi:hypothetical protein